MSKRVKLTIKQDDENVDLKTLLEKYMRRSEELEIKENTILKQIEIIQSAVASLREWNERRKASTSSATEPVQADVKDIDEETRMIREETERIQEEIRKKIIENRLLQEEVNRKKMLEAGLMEEHKESPAAAFGEEIECRLPPVISTKPSIEFFLSKLKSLKEMQRALSEESRQKVEETKKRKQELSQKIDRLEVQLEEDRNRIFRSQKAVT